MDQDEETNMHVMENISLESFRDCIVRRAHDTIALFIFRTGGSEVAVMTGKLCGH